MILRYTHAYRELAVLLQVLVFAVYRDKELRLRQRDHHFQLVLAGVAGYVNLVHRLVNYLGALLHQLVHNLCHQLFVAGYRGRRDDYKVHRCYSDLPVVTAGHSGER